MSAFPEAVRQAADQMNAADLIAKAAMVELEAFIQLRDREQIEAARDKALSAYEAFLDRKIAAFQLLQRHL